MFSRSRCSFPSYQWSLIWYVYWITWKYPEVDPRHLCFLHTPQVQPTTALHALQYLIDNILLRIQLTELKTMTCLKYRHYYVHNESSLKCDQPEVWLALVRGLITLLTLIKSVNNQNLQAFFPPMNCYSQISPVLHTSFLFSFRIRCRAMYFLLLDFLLLF